ncbi:hypothetical protein L3X38_023597 [Prunus dulcis]|uniref:Uncharacterized protein n=1 Tax=Prunus dulcis TaxID=3755 RepID=A0AAD4W0Q9_PRUDU|nr:hypothetical protein L3X38_023597 [Prunus dulcis]
MKANAKPTCSCKSQMFSKTGGLVMDVSRILASMPSFSVHYVLQITNGVADRIAHYGLSQEDLAFWFDVPPL